MRFGRQGELGWGEGFGGMRDGIIGRCLGWRPRGAATSARGCKNWRVIVRSCRGAIVRLFAGLHFRIAVSAPENLLGDRTGEMFTQRDPLVKHACLMRRVELFSCDSGPFVSV